MPCPRCGSTSYRSGDLRCRNCPYEVCIGPGTDLDRYNIPSSPPAVSMGVATWKDICPVCAEQTFDGHDCSNPSCKYGIPEKNRKMQPRTMSPDASERLRQRLGIP